MQKNKFLSQGSAQRAIEPVLPQQHERLLNWAGNLEYSSSLLYRAQTLEQVCEIVKYSGRIKVLGTRHCFNRIADSGHQFISLLHMNKVLSLNEQEGTVTVEAGMNYGQLCPFLHQHGLALHNLASLPHISIAGACATATHGSGHAHGNLATAVTALEMVTAAGDILKLSPGINADMFRAAVVNMGALGVVTSLTLKTEKAFFMRQYVFENLPLSTLEKHFEEIISTGYSISLFTDWQSENFTEAWIKTRDETENRFEPRAEFFGAKSATANLHPIAGIAAENCTEQMGVPGEWYERLPHFRMGYTPSSGQELQSEYYIPRRYALDAIFAVSTLKEKLAPWLFISEIRTVAADDLWMSPCYNESCITIHFTWKPDWTAVCSLLPEIEALLAPFNARPHWGKLFLMEPGIIHGLYQKLPGFVQLAAQTDPEGKFRNSFVDRYIFDHKK
jgi:xylitol oxidase